MTGTGHSHGAITVINAIPCGIGATIGIDLATDATFEVGGGSRTVEIAGEPDEDGTLARTCVSAVYATAGIDEPDGWTLRIESEIPISRGLKSSSAACNAVIRAVADELGLEAEPVDMIRLGVQCAREAGVTVTGPAVAMVVPFGRGIEFAEAMGLSPDDTLIASTRC